MTAVAQAPAPRHLRRRVVMSWAALSKLVQTGALGEPLRLALRIKINVPISQSCGHLAYHLSGGQGFLLVQRHVQRLQAPLQGLLPHRARGHVPRHRGAGVQRGRKLTRVAVMTVTERKDPDAHAGPFRSFSFGGRELGQWGQLLYSLWQTPGNAVISDAIRVR